MGQEIRFEDSNPVTLTLIAATQLVCMKRCLAKCHLSNLMDTAYSMRILLEENHPRTSFTDSIYQINQFITNQEPITCDQERDGKIPQNLMESPREYRTLLLGLLFDAVGNNITSQLFSIPFTGFQYSVDLVPVECGPRARYLSELLHEQPSFS